MQNSLFDRIGGDTAAHQLVERLYELMDQQYQAWTTWAWITR